MTTSQLSIVVPVFRDADRAVALATALLGCDRGGWQVEIIIVDDGSGDGSADWIENRLSGAAKVMKLSVNVGRARARNAGAGMAKGSWLLFIDADCLPADPRFLEAHLSNVMDGTVASTGPVLGTGHGFWSDYQRLASERRARSHAQGMSYIGAASNMAVSRRAFHECGGFDEAYRGYGFEDRDLLLRLAGLGSIAWADGARVRHMDELDLAVVCRKFQEAAGAPAERFDQIHPEAYRRLGYALLDARHHPLLHWPARIAAVLAHPLAVSANHCLHWRLLPFQAKALLVKGISALGYLAGTASTR